MMRFPLVQSGGSESIYPIFPTHLLYDIYPALRVRIRILLRALDPSAPEFQIVWSSTLPCSLLMMMCQSVSHVEPCGISVMHIIGLWNSLPQDVGVAPGWDDSETGLDRFMEDRSNNVH